MTSADLECFSSGIAERGWAITPPIVDESTITHLRAAVAPLAVDRRGGARNLLDLSEIRALANSVLVRLLAVVVLGSDCFATRALLFDKRPDANWKVVWHQDLTVAARARADVAGYGPWTEKAGVPHVQPPISVLETMLAIRIHLDPCGIENGPVRVIERSHRLGRLSGEAIEALRRDLPEANCLVEQGGVLAF